MPARDRVLVVGAGPHGLICARRLAEAGLDVMVLEQASAPGGAVTSFAGPLPGFLHDRCAGFFPLAAASPAFPREVLERHGVRWISPPVAMAHPFQDGGSIVLHRDLEATVASIDAAAPGAGDGWRSLAGLLLEHSDLVLKAGLGRFPPVAAGAALGLRLRGRALELGRLMLASAVTFGREVFGHERPTAWLSGSAVHTDLGPDAPGSGAFGLVLKFLGHLVGWPFPEGGAGRITEALIADLARQGGNLRCQAPVEGILCRGGRVAGVQLRDGERVEAGTVVAAVTAGPLRTMLPDEALPSRLMRRLERWRYGLGTFKVDFALDGPVPWDSEDARRAGVVHVGDTVEHFVAAVHQATEGEVPDKPTMVVGQQSLHDPTRAPEGKHTLYAYTHVPQRPGSPDEEIADRMEERIADFAPGFRDLVLAREVRSPRRLEQENPSLVGGDLGGGTVELDQQLVFRPAPELIRYRTPLRGLYVASSSIHPGPGVHGVCGAGAARAVLEDRSPLRFWR